MEKEKREEDLTFAPQFDDNGLIPCITTCAKTGEVLMFAFMNEESLALTIETGQAHYWSRSRKSLWRKGESSGFIQHVTEMRTDCDQDCLWIKVNIGEGKKPSATCHTGRKSCFYRKIATGSNNKHIKMEFIEAEKIFDPEKIYNR